MNNFPFKRDYLHFAVLLLAALATGSFLSAQILQPDLASSNVQGQVLGTKVTAAAIGATCGGSYPEAATTTATSGTFKAIAIGVDSAQSMVFPTWINSDQSDIIWYPGIHDAGGDWHADIDLANHKGLGTINVHVYMNYPQSPVFCGTASFSRVAAAAPAPAVSLTASPNPVAYNGTTYLSYTSANAGNCVAYRDGAFLAQPGLSYSNYPVTNMTANSTFRVDCNNSAGAVASASVTVSVQAQPLPTVDSFSATPASIAYGGSTTLFWSSSNATSCTSPQLGSSGSSGSMTIGPLYATTTGTIICTGPGGTSVQASTTVTVGAAPVPCAFSISPNLLSTVSSASTQSVSVTNTSGSNCTWTAASNDSWLTITSGTSGTGSGTVNYSVAANTSTSSRTGTLTIAGNTATVVQYGAVVVVPDPTAYITINDVHVATTVQSGASATLRWITSNVASCNYITANGSPTPYNQIVSSGLSTNGGVDTGPINATTVYVLTCTGLNGSTVSDTVTVTVTAAPTCTYTVTPATFSADNNSNTKTVTVGTGNTCAWTAASNASWLTVSSGATGTGQGSVTILIATNSGTSARTGTLTIGGQAVTVTQAAGTASCTGNGATVSVQTPPPATMTAGQTAGVILVVSNTCSTTWTASANYHLGSQNPQDNFDWGLSRVNLPMSLAPGQSVPLTFSITAPATSGTHHFQWQMVQDGVEWFGTKSNSVDVNVSAVPVSPTGPAVTVLSPNGGEQIVVGQATTIKWKRNWMPDGANGLAQVFYRRNGLNTSIAPSASDAGFAWNVPADLTPGTDYKIVVTSAGTGGSTTAPLTDESDATFTVVAPGTLTITTPSVLPSATAGTVYQTNFTATGGTSTYVWSLSSGTLPPGISLGSAGIAGTPVAGGNYTFTITVASGSVSVSKQFSLAVGSPTPTPLVNIKPIGYVDGVTTDGYIVGWAADANHPDLSVDVHVYFDAGAVRGGTPLPDRADENRPDVIPAIPGATAGSKHGFKIKIPDAYRDGRSHTVFVYAIDPDDTMGNSNTELLGSPDKKQFELKLAPAVTVISPNGGEQIVAGQAFMVKWNRNWMPDGANGLAQVFYRRNGLNTSIAPSASDAGFSWNVPADFTPGTDYKIVVTSLGMGGSVSAPLSDESDSAFSIVAPNAPVVTVITPNGGESYRVGSSIPLSWRSINVPEGAKVSLGLYKDNSPLTELAYSLTPTGTDSVPILAADTILVPGSGYKLQASLVKAGVTLSSDTSDATFSIVRSQSEAPNGSVRHARGTVVLDQGTVYFLGADLRYPFPSEAIFLSWGNRFSDIVPANAGDLAMPIGPVAEMKQ